MAWRAPLLIVVLNIERSTGPRATLNRFHQRETSIGVRAVDRGFHWRCVAAIREAQAGRAKTSWFEKGDDRTM
jgi:hypothetical protein